MPISKRYRHPCDTELKRNPLAYTILDAIRSALWFHPHPDSSRQRKTRKRDLERARARKVKILELQTLENKALIHQK